MSSPAADRIPGYRIVRELGRGGMAVVYLAVQESLGREVALKLLSRRLAEDPVAAERFVREARTAARLVHRHIVGIHDVGVHEGQPYFAMEYLPGDTVAGRQFTPAQSLEVARETACALDHAHREGVIHRDIKPENILRRADGSCALADFGIARTTDAGSAMTQAGETLGTPHYMSPEQLQGRPLDGRADLYSLGVVLYQLLTGELPYQGTDGWSIGLQHISAPIPRLPPTLARYQPLVDALMAKDPSQRPQTGADAAALIEGYATGTGASNPTIALVRPQAPRRGPLMAAAAVAVLAVAGWIGWTMYQGGRGAAGVDATAAAATPAKQQRSIAVLPLVNLSGNAENDYFSDGLAETLLDMLARVPDLKVIARTSSFAFKDKPMDVREIGKALNATHLLEGSVQQSGQQLRITMQLIRASDGAHLWSQRYDRQLADVFAVQDEVATEVVKALRVALPQADAKRVMAGRPENVAAYQEYLKGISLWRLRKVDDMRKALAHFERAIELDPLYARAYAAAGNTLILLHSHVGLSAEEKKHGETLIERALQLDPELGEAYIARAGLLQPVDPKAAERDFRRGIELAPSYATGLQWYGEYLANDRGEPEKALPIFQRAIEIDPLAPILRTEMARTLLQLNRVEEAEQISAQMLADYPEFALTHALRSDVLAQKGDLAGALRAADRRVAADPAATRGRTLRCELIASSGAIAQAEKCIAAMEKDPQTAKLVAGFKVSKALADGDPQTAARILAQMENPDDWQKAYALRSVGRLDEAEAVYRGFLPDLFKVPLDNPSIASPYDAVDVGAILIAQGKRSQGEAVLRHGLTTMAKRPRTGNSGKAWADVFSYTLLGDYAKACAMMDQAVRENYFGNHHTLKGELDLAPLRKQPCFAPAYARVKALADKQVAAATKAGLM